MQSGNFLIWQLSLIVTLIEVLKITISSKFNKYLTKFCQLLGVILLAIIITPISLYLDIQEGVRGILIVKRSY